MHGPAVFRTKLLGRSRKYLKLREDGGHREDNRRNEVPESGSKRRGNGESYGLGFEVARIAGLVLSASGGEPHPFGRGRPERDGS